MSAQRRPRAALRRDAVDILRRALAAVDPVVLLRRHLRRTGDVVLAGGHPIDIRRGRLVVIAAGKASSRMIGAAAGLLGGRAEALLAIDVSDRVPVPPGVRRLVAGHPLPDRRGLAAAREVERLASHLGREDSLLLLLSGGASALLPAPAEGLRLGDKTKTTRLLLESGADIGELNAVRRHLSRLKGGGLARVASPARVVALALSDVIGDDPATIGSGPASADPTTYDDALGVLARRGLLDRVPGSVVDHLEAGRRGERPETLKPGDPLLRRTRFVLIGGNRAALDAATRRARALGYGALPLTSTLQGEARDVATVLCAVLRECVVHGRPQAPPVCLLAGGETTVRVVGRGRGGRNQEMAAAAALALAELPVPAVLASCASDGVDGTSSAAGGLVDDRSAHRARAAGLDVARLLADNDSHRLLAGTGDLLQTGPTGTNVMDLTILLAASRARRAQLR